MIKPKKKDSDDLNLIKLIKNDNCNDSFVLLLERHSNLFYAICNKFHAQVDLDEIYKDKEFVFI